MRHKFWMFITILSLVAGCCRCYAHQFNIFCNVDEGKFLPLSTYNEMGVKFGWFHVKLPVHMSKSGNAEWASEKLRERICNAYIKFNRSDIKLFLVVNILQTFHEDENDVLQKNIIGNDWQYRSFSSSTANIAKSLEFLIDELKDYKAFGGICIDDEPAIIAGGCYNNLSIDLFKTKYGMFAPSKEDFFNEKNGIIKSKTKVLTWMDFQRKQMHMFYCKLVKKIKEKNPNCPLYSIPAGSWICGKTISVPSSPIVRAKSLTLGVLDSCYLKDFHLYTQYAFTKLDENGWSEKVASGLCQTQFIPPNCARNLVPTYSADKSGKFLSELAFQRYVLQTFSEGSKGIAYWPIRAFSTKIVQKAKELYQNQIKHICSKAPNLTRYKGKVAVLVSRSTLDYASVWKSNPIERFEHLHQCEALEYYLFKRGIPFDIILENEINDYKSIEGYKIIMSAGIKYLTRDMADYLEKFINNGGKFITDKSTKINIVGTTLINFNPSYWYNTLKGQFQQESDLEFQAGVLQSKLDTAIPESFVICHSTSRHLNLNYLTDGEGVYLFIVNNSLSGNIKSELHFNKPYSIAYLLTGKKLQKTKKLSVDVPCGTIIALKLD